MRLRKTLHRTVTLPHEQCIDVLHAVVRWSRGQKAYAPCPHMITSLKSSKPQYADACIGPRTHQARMVSVLPLVTTKPSMKLTTHAVAGLPAADDADQ